MVITKKWLDHYESGAKYDRGGLVEYDKDMAKLMAIARAALEVDEACGWDSPFTYPDNAVPALLRLHNVLQGEGE